LLSKSAKIKDCLLLNLPKIQNPAGSITPVTNAETIPFSVKRVFYLYDIPGGESRGAHAHKECHQFIVAASGSFDIELNDGITSTIVTLRQPYVGLHIPPGIWASEISFSSGAICLVLASQNFNEADYIRDYEEYLKFKQY
jgi:hypothetical protein